MFKTTLIILILLSFCDISIAQIQEEVYYKDKYKSIELSDKRGAKFKEVITVSEDSTKTIRFYRIKSQNLTLLEEFHFKNGNQTGIWKFYDKKGRLKYQTDYTTELKYIKGKIESDNYVTFERNDVISLNEAMIPPKILGQENIFYAVYGNLKYPAYARENGIQGEVVLNCRINKSGSMDIIGIIESSHPILEKPAWIALNNCSEWIPAQIDKSDVDSYFIMPVKFKLE